MRALITGSQGFVGGYLRRELEENGYEVTGLDLRTGEKALRADLLNLEQTAEMVCQAAPDVVFHLAGQADVGLSWRNPGRTFELNVIAAVNLLEAVREYEPRTKMVLVGSSDEYGSLGEAGQSVSEELELKPQTPYAVSKKAQEELARVYARAYGMNICMTRSFNHVGIGQPKGFVIPDLISGIVSVERKRSKVLLTGNLAASRDFTDVRDVVRAYRLIAEQGERGEVYNVGSGKTWNLQVLLDKLISMARCEIPVQKDPERMRPIDTPYVRCDPSKLRAATGWEPEIDIEQTLKEMMEYARKNGMKGY